MAGRSEESPHEPIDPVYRELESELARPARFIEPSAAERARKPGRKNGWRTARRARKLREPVPEPRSGQQAAGRRGRPAGSGRVQPPVPERRRGRHLLTAAIVIACLAGAGYGITRLKTFGGADQTPVTNGPTPHVQAAAPGIPALTAADPFAGSPAGSYAAGAAGIAIPAAHPVGSYSAAQVAAAYRETKKMLVAAHLDPRTLRGGSPDSFAGMLIPSQRSYFIGRLDKMGLSSSRTERSTRGWVTSFAPGVNLVGNVIKVHGAMHAATGRNGSWHVLQVRADYLFVYAVEWHQQAASLMRVVVRDVVDVDFAAYTGGPLEPWWVTRGGGEAGARCDVNDGYLHPQFPNGPPDKVRPTGTPINPYNQSTPPSRTAGCQATTGT